MSNNLTKVSLGFAEFVSQLLHETFDAVLSSQNYQIEKFIELTSLLQSSNDEFKNKFVTNQEIEEFIIEKLGTIIVSNIAISKGLNDLLKEFFSEDEVKKIISNGVISDEGVGIVKNYFTNILINIKRHSIQQLLTANQNSKIIVDSGEISAKLELFCLNESNETEENKEKDVGVTDTNKPKKLLSDIKQMDATPIQQQIKKMIFVKEIVDNDTKEKTLLIDKSKLLESKKIIQALPNTRLVANPSIKSTTNAYSEIKIKFRYG